MTEIRSGIRHVLAHPAAYDCFQHCVGAYAWRKAVIARFIREPTCNGGLIVDIGCGTSEVLRYLPEGFEYLGFDRNQQYIARARSRYAHRNARFINAELSSDSDLNGRRADVVLAFGILHHLNDEQSLNLFHVAKRFLREDGMMLTLDPVFVRNQSPLAKYVISKDRGTAVRSENAYRELAGVRFTAVESYVDLNPLRIPYTGVVMKCSG